MRDAGERGAGRGALGGVRWVGGAPADGWVGGAGERGAGERGVSREHQQIQGLWTK
jgi:hypothetical protein